MGVFDFSFTPQQKQNAIIIFRIGIKFLRLFFYKNKTTTTTTTDFGKTYGTRVALNHELAIMKRTPDQEKSTCKFNYNQPFQA